ncbi:hypothetical protein CDV55_107517 [Aspergillus turcosus]|nr:hypothetical protein CDV55_107517 [Aspergillus turcosus]
MQALTGMCIGLLIYRLRRYKWIAIAGAIVQIISYRLMIRLHTNTSSLAELFIIQLIQGLGSRIIKTVSIVAAQICVTHSELAQVTSLVMLGSFVGNAIGSAIAGGIYTGALRERLHVRLGGAVGEETLDQLYNSITGALPVWGTSERVAVNQAQAIELLVKPSRPACASTVEPDIHHWGTLEEDRLLLDPKFLLFWAAKNGRKETIGKIQTFMQHEQTEIDPVLKARVLMVATRQPRAAGSMAYGTDSLHHRDKHLIRGSPQDLIATRSNTEFIYTSSVSYTGQGTYHSHPTTSDIFGSNTTNVANKINNNLANYTAQVSAASNSTMSAANLLSLFKIQYEIIDVASLILPSSGDSRLLSRDTLHLTTAKPFRAFELPFRGREDVSYFRLGAEGADPWMERVGG